MTSTNAHKFIGYGDIHGTKAFKCIGSGVIHGPKPYEFIGSGDNHGPKPYEFIGFGDIQYYRSLSIGKSMPFKTGVWRGKSSAKIGVPGGLGRQPEVARASPEVAGGSWVIVGSGPRWGTTLATLRLPR